MTQQADNNRIQQMDEKFHATACPGNHPNGDACVYYHNVHEGISTRVWIAGMIASGSSSNWEASVEDLAEWSLAIADSIMDLNSLQRGEAYAKLKESKDE